MAHLAAEPVEKSKCRKHVSPPHNLRYRGGTTAHRAKEGHRSRRSCPLRICLAPGPIPLALGRNDVGGFRELVGSPTACVEVRLQTPLCNEIPLPSHPNDPRAE